MPSVGPASVARHNGDYLWRRFAPWNGRLTDKHGWVLTPLEDAEPLLLEYFKVPLPNVLRSRSEPDFAGIL